MQNSLEIHNVGAKLFLKAVCNQKCTHPLKTKYLHQ
jgi:hypothetical protein